MCLQWWHQHAVTPPWASAAPSETSSSSSSIPLRGLPCKELLGLLQELTDLAAWQAWDVRHLLDPLALAHVSGAAGLLAGHAALLGRLLLLGHGTSKRMHSSDEHG